MLLEDLACRTYLFRFLLSPREKDTSIPVSVGFFGINRKALHFLKIQSQALNANLIALEKILVLALPRFKLGSFEAKIYELNALPPEPAGPDSFRCYSVTKMFTS